MKKLIFSFIILILISIFSFALEDEENKAEFSFNIGGSFTQLDSSSNYTSNWNWLLITNAQENGTIDASSQNSLFFSGSFNYYFLKNIGLQVGFGYMKTDVNIDASFDFSWRWYSGRSYSRNADWEETGKLTVIPININGIAKFNNSKFGGYISGGYTLFNNKFNANSDMGAGITAWCYNCFGYYVYQWIDAAQIPLTIDESWAGHGMNVGAGIDFRISENLAITADARYYYCPSKDINWNWQTGRYTGIFYRDFSAEVDMEAVEFLEEHTTSLTVKPSFFQIAAGIKFYF